MSRIFNRLTAAQPLHLGVCVSGMDREDAEYGLSWHQGRGYIFGS